MNDTCHVTLLCTYYMMIMLCYNDVYLCTQEPERVASMVADAVQQMLMDLKLQRVPMVPLYSHTPPLPLVLVSTPEEILSSSSHDQGGATPNDSTVTLIDDSMSTTPLTSTTIAAGSVTTVTTNGTILSESSQMTSESAATTPSAVDMVTPVTEEACPISTDSKAVPSSPSLPPWSSPTRFRSARTEVQTAEPKLSNGSPHADVGVNFKYM